LPANSERRVSTDAGKTWGKPQTIDTGDAEKPSGFGGGGGLFSQGGLLWSFNYAFGSNHLTGGHMRSYRYDEALGKWEYKARTEVPFWPHTKPEPMDDGNWIMSGLLVGNGNPAAVAISHGTDFTAWDIIKIPQVDRSWMWGESFVIVDGPDLMNVARYDQTTGVALVAYSKDYGRSWSRSEPSNLPMTGTKPAGGRLSTGHAFLIATTAADSDRIPISFGDRFPLTIALSSPGERTFSKLYVIRHAEFPEGPGESHETAALSYPSVVEHEGKLCVSYSNNGPRMNNFNSIELAIIPLESLVHSEDAK